MDTIYFLQMAYELASKQHREFLCLLIGMALLEAQELEARKATEPNAEPFNEGI